MNQQKALWERLQRYQWDTINLPYYNNVSNKPNRIRKVCWQADSDAEQVRQRWEDAKMSSTDLAIQKVSHKKI